MRFSSAFKVGILTLLAIIILVFSILWIKGRSLSSGSRYDVDFKDVNGIRVGSAVQIMGIRVGQIESMTPIIKGEDSVVRLRFVITDPSVKNIPKASTISIQQSGLIGELFLEIMPPKIKNIYIPISKQTNHININNDVEMLLDSKYEKVGKIKTIDIIDVNTLPMNVQDELKVQNAYKIGYVINMPGLVVPENVAGRIVTNGKESKLRLILDKNVVIHYPKTDSDYTIIEPTRLSDFMQLQYKAASSLATTNERLSTLLSDDVINDLKASARNINTLTAKANTTMEKAEMLIDASRTDLDVVMNDINILSGKLNKLADGLNSIVGDQKLKENIANTSKSINRLSNNLNRILEDKNTQNTLNNLQVASKNIAEISAYVNDMTKDEQLKTNLNSSLIKFNKALDELTIALQTVNNMTTPEEQLKIKQTLSDASSTAQNLRKFSEKLNKRFLLFRLMF